LQGYDFQIIYQPGKENVVADALSRQGQDSTLILLAVSSPISQLIQELQTFFATTEGQEVVHACTSSQQHPSLFSTRHNLLFFLPSDIRASIN